MLCRLEHSWSGTSDTGFAVIALAKRLETTDVVLHHLSKGLAPTGTTVLARNSGLAWSYLAASDGVIAASWYDRATDGNYAAVVDASGRRTSGLRRLDDPAVRSSSGHPAVMSVNAGWRWFWTDPQRLQTAR